MDPPNDPYYPYQSALKSSLSSDGSISGAWSLRTDAPDVIVAVIDSGADLDHPDLAANLWANSGEIEGNGIDDDGNGFVDDVHGYDFRNNDGESLGEPEDEWGHGSLVAGIMGNAGNNGIGSTGVAWSIRMMILKVFGSSGGGSVSDFVSAIDYAIDNGARIINASWTVKPVTQGDEIQELKDAIQRASDAGILVVAAAGNDSEDLDEIPAYPAAYSSNNVISVAALGEDGETLLSNSSYGSEMVHVAAAGKEVIGSYLSGEYATLTGTSAAAAIVSGVSALVMASGPDLTPAEIRNILVETSDPAELLDGFLQSGGVLNAYEAIVEASLPPLVTTQGSGDSETFPKGGQENSQETGEVPMIGGCSLIP